MLYPSLQKTIELLADKQPAIANERKARLDELTVAIQNRLRDPSIRLQFICTHNSRRSVFSQVWAQALAHYFHLDHMQCHSGGTSATAVYPAVIDTLKEQGFHVEKLTGKENPKYTVWFGSSLSPLDIWSKTFGDPSNPDTFVAVMTCSEADEACPYVPGAEVRISLPYDDPKEFDGLSEEKKQYLARAEQIAAELYHVFQNLPK